MHTKRIDTPKESEFSRLMISKETGAILLATGEADKDHLIGLIIVSSNNNNSIDRVGRYEEVWAKDNFYDYPGQVILSNHKIDE